MKYILLSFLLTVIVIQSTAQENEFKRKNAVIIELAGPMIMGYGIAYERTVVLTKTVRMGFRGGIGKVNNFTKTSSHLGFNYIFGKHRGFELGANYLFDYDASTFMGHDDDDDMYQNGMQFLMGYRYQSYKNGIIFRIYWVPPVACCGSYLPYYGGLSLGYSL